VQAMRQINGLLGVNSMTESKSTKREYGYKNLAQYQLAGWQVNVRQFFAGKINHCYVAWLILQVHGQILILQILTEVVTIVAIYIAIRMFLNIFLPQHLPGNSCLI